MSTTLESADDELDNALLFSELLLVTTETELLEALIIDEDTALAIRALETDEALASDRLEAAGTKFPPAAPPPPPQLLKIPVRKITPNE